MPVGVPKVPFRIPGDEEASWVDLYNRLHRQRVLFLGRELTVETGNQIISLLVYLSIEDKTKEFFLFINSPGGLIIPGIGVYDAMQAAPADVHTLCVGIAVSMASFILVGGEFSKRIAYPHARVMIHQPLSTFFQSQAGNVTLELTELTKARETVLKVYVQRTGKPRWIISQDLERDVFMSAEEAQTHGIVDFVGIEEKTYTENYYKHLT